MELTDCISNRYSLRNYKDQPIEKEKLLAVLDAARLAPSAVNNQPLCFIVISEPEGLKKLKKCYPREWIQNAPVIIVGCGDHAASWKRKDGKDHCDIDMAIATEHICLAAVEQGLGTCWVCNFDTSLCRDILHLPEHLEPIVLLPIGYAAEERGEPRVRKSLNEIVKWENY